MTKTIQSILDQEVKEGSLKGRSDWLITKTKDWNCSYTNIVYKYRKLTSQGIKLHVSASLLSSKEVLSKVFPILISNKVSFKFACTETDLLNLLNGKCGKSQVGKFVTVYPYDENTAVNLGIILDKCTRGLGGPPIPYEKSLGHGSIVYYRYGSFVPRFVQTNRGDIVPGIIDPEGNLIPDDREDIRQGYDWIEDPFLKAGVKVKSRDPKRKLFKGHYLPVKLLYNSNVKGLSWIGIDTSSAEKSLVVIKLSYKDVMVEPNHGVDASKRLEKEYKTMQIFQNFDFCPRLIDFWKDSDHSLLIYKFVEGVSLGSFVKSIRNNGITIPEKLIIKWGISLCDILSFIHEKNYIFLDIKPDNLIIDKNEHFYLIDYENVTHISSSLIDCFFTSGYCSPQMLERSNPSYQDDVYAVGAILFNLTTKIEPSLLPSRWDYQYYFSSIDSQASVELQRIILRCLNREKEKRYATVDEIKKELEEIRIEKVKQNNNNFRFTSNQSFFRYLANNLGIQLCNEAEHTGDCAFWRTKHPTAYGQASRDLYNGVSGITIFLIDLYRSTRNELFINYAKKGAEWLNITADTIGRKKPLPGLYFGEAGIGLCYLRLYEITGIQGYLDRSIERSNIISKIEYASPDLLNGAAGTGLYHLMLFDTTNDQKFLKRAKNVGQFLLNSVDTTDGQYCWKIPEGYKGLSNHVYLGFAHGAAGIGYYLFELAQTTNDSKYLASGNNIAEYLINISQPSLDNGDASNWSTELGRPLAGPWWCHGSAGIGKFFLKAYEVTNNQNYLDMAKRSGKMTYEGGNWVGTTQCHGLAGNIEFLLDMSQVLKDQSYFNEAYRLGTLLETYKIDVGSTFKWYSESPDLFTPDYMIGNSGIGHCFLRLTDNNISDIIARKIF